VSEDQLTLAVIVGSVREGRFAPVVANWFIGRAEEQTGVRLDVIDLAESGRTGGLPDEFTARIDSADAFIVVTPEYNHGYPGPLKTAIDSVYAEWRAKPVGFVSYGGISGGLRSVEQLRIVFAELHAVTVRETVSFHMAGAQFDEDGRPRDPESVNAAAAALLDQVTWWAHALRDARRVRPYAA
jgi:NAD(P)H-dependent FMN reductase